MRDPQAIANATDKLCFGTTLLAQAMIDGCGFYAAGPRCRGKQQQGKAVGAAGNRDAEIRTVANQR